jgi:hypothetical protein
MIASWRAAAGAPRPHAPPGESSIVVAVRKRPLASRGGGERDWDAISCLNPRVVVHAPKLKVDGITKFLDNQAFNFDHVRASSKRRRRPAPRGGARRAHQPRPPPRARRADV